MFGNREEIRRRLLEVAERFRQKGATSPERAMTAQELGLPPRFEQAMHRRLGKTGILVETEGKYYLNEERLKEIQEQRARGEFGSNGGGAGNSGRVPTWTRVVGVLLMLPIGIIVLLVLFYVGAFGEGYFPGGEFLIILLVIMIALLVARLVFWRSRRKRWPVY